MPQHFRVEAELRRDVGKGASRRLRRGDDRVPGIIYGGGREPQPLTLSIAALNKSLESEAFYSQIIDVVVDGETQQAVLRDVQRHPASHKLQHIDFLRITADQPIDVHIPLHFVNEDKCVGVKQGGGNIVHNTNEVLVRCLPKDLPQYIEVDMTDVAVGQTVHLSDLKLPPNVRLVELIQGEEHDAAVVSVVPPRGGAGEEGEEGAEGTAAEGTPGEGA
ncbi:MAG TPA: 50S ribosomal protein L25/general stress protein Ctc [Pseudomonadales bacterium]